MARFGKIGDQYFDDAGDPLVEGLLYFYESGTTTAKTTYADSGLTIPNANPVQLSGAGRQPNIFFNGTAKVILTDKDYVQIEVRDPEGGALDTQFAPWVASTSYNVGDLVTGSNGSRYVSITSGNVNNDPTSDTTNWTRVQFVGTWNALVTYAVNDLVQGSNGRAYVCVAANTGNDPTTDLVETNWAPASTPYTVGDVAFSADSSKYPAPAWLLCDGSPYNEVTYAGLAAVTGALFTALPAPATAPAGSSSPIGGPIEWSNVDDSFVVVAHATSPYITIYERSGDTFTKISNPATLPASTSYEASFNNDDSQMAVAHTATPFVTIYSVSGTTFTKLANPASLPAGNGTACDFTPDGGHLAVGHFTSPYMTVYSVSGTTFTKLANPATLPTGNVYKVKWSPDNTKLAVGNVASPFVSVYTLSGSTLTKTTDAATLPTDNVYGLAWDSTSTYLAVATRNNATSNLIIYKWNGTSLDHLTYVSGVPTTQCNAVWFDSDDNLYAIFQTSGSELVKVLKSGDTFTVTDTDFATFAVGGTPYDFAKSKTETYAGIVALTSPYLYLYKSDYVTPTISVDTSNLAKAYIKT